MKTTNNNHHRRPVIAHFAALALVAVVPQPGANADTIAQWTFETSVPATAGPFAAEVGTGQALGFHTNGATVYSNPAGNISAESFSSNTWSVGDYYQFMTSTTGFSDIALTWDQTGSGTGPRDFKLAYSTDGSTFTDFASYAVLLNGTPNLPWGTATGGSVYSYSYDLSAIPALDNDSSVFFRLINTSTVAINLGAVATGGTNRVDNFAINGTPVPEPTTAVSLIGGLAMLIGLRRARRSSI